MTPYTLLRQHRNKLYPPELVFGAEIEVEWMKGQPTEKLIWGTREEMRLDEKEMSVFEDNIHGDIVANLGLPLSLNDVLRMLAMQNNAYSIDTHGALWKYTEKWHLIKTEDAVVIFNLSLPLDHEDNEGALKEVCGLLGVANK